MTNKQKIALITGITGQDGSYLAEFLLEKGYIVHGIKRRASSFNTERIDHLYQDPHINHPDLILHYGDLTDTSNLARIIQECQPDEIYNLACPASPKYYQQDPIQTTKTSFLGAYNLLGLAKRTGAKILQASTSEIYGDPQVHPQPEDYWGNVNPIGIRSCYDEGKRAAETLFFDYHRQHDVRIKVMRIFNTYGPKMAPDDGRVVSNFIVQALTDQNITIYGDGSQTRSFCYVDDLVQGMLLLMQTGDDITGPINVGNPSEFTMLQLAEKVLEFIPYSKSEIVFMELPKDDPKQRRPNISEAREKLGWNPIVPLDRGLETTINYFKGLLDH